MGSGYPKCKTCAHYVAEPGAAYGSCESPKFVKGYMYHFVPQGRRGVVPSDGVMVEDDEGWGFYVGSDFGCVHHTGLN